MLELEAGEPIHGRLAASREPARPFHGWLELTALLDRLCPTDTAPGLGDDPPSTPPH